METDLTPDAAIDRFLSRLEPVDALAVALSGGSDSTALLHLLHRRAAVGDAPRLIAITVDHGLRAGSDEEAKTVAAACAALGIEHRIAKWTGRKPATGLQEAARLARYDLLRGSALAAGADVVVTGHTQDDQIETAIMRGERGDGRGLSGMAEAVLYRGDCWILRPLLSVRRAALRDLLGVSGISWIEDPSNLDERFERARMRLAGGPASADVEMLSMIDSAAAARRGDAAVLARFVDAHALVHAGMIAELPQVPAEISEHLQPAIGLFTALMGGRAHRPGAKSQTQIDRFSADIGPPRITLGGSMLDRRADRIFIYREKRGQRRVSAGPGQTILWDARYRFSNADPQRRFTIAPTAAGNRPTLLNLPTGSNPPTDIPPGVVSRARAAEPTIIAETPDGAVAVPAEELPQPLSVTRHLPLFDLFLPEFDRILADKCAGLFGRPTYRSLPLR